MTTVKICGIKDEINLAAALSAGADFVGFVFFPPSPRHIERAQAAVLSQQAKGRTRRVGLFVDPRDADLETVLKEVELDFIQLHGTESPVRVSEIYARFDIPIIKAVRVSGAADIDKAKAFDAAAWLIFDAHVSGDLPGGTGQRLDWGLLEGAHFDKPWMLSGGLDAANVARALKHLQPDGVDVSSGVEKSRGEKDSTKIQDFVTTVRNTHS